MADVADDLDRIRWFDKLGVCQCGRPASGTLRGTIDEPIAVCCDNCARRLIDKSLRNRGLNPHAPATYRGQEWWEHTPRNLVAKFICRHGHGEQEDCPICSGCQEPGTRN